MFVPPTEREWRFLDCNSSHFVHACTARFMNTRMTRFICVGRFVATKGHEDPIHYVCLRKVFA
jgi:hypothetical protein